MNAQYLNVGIVGLGRWARVLTPASRRTDKLNIIACFDVLDEARAAFEKEMKVPVAPTLEALVKNPEIQGVIITVPNEQHLEVATKVAEAGKHVYTEKPIAATLEEGLQLAALAKKHGVTVTVGHSARLMAGIRQMREAIDAGELGRVAYLEANFSNERALELTPKTWRWYKHRAPGGPLSQLAIHHFDVLHYLGGEVQEVSSMASKLSPVGAEVDDQSMTLIRFTDGKVGFVGSCWTSPGVFAVRVYGSKGLMDYEIDFGAWDKPNTLHESSTLYIQRGKGGYATREILPPRESDMFVAELEMFAESCRTGRPNELDGNNGCVAVAMVYGALRSIDQHGQYVPIADVIADARKRLT